MQAFLDTDEGATGWCLEYIRALRRGQLKPFSYAERKTRAATRGSTPWGPTGPQLRELAAASEDRECLEAIFRVLNARCAAGHGKGWKKVYKALLVLEWLATRGSPAAVERATGMRFVVENLTHYHFVEQDSGVDQGANVRQRATTVLALLSDAEALNEQREKQRRQYWAVSSDTAPTPTSNDIDEYEADRRSRSRAALGDSSTSGNTKGVSAADMERNKRVLSQLCRLESNRLCADCRQPPATWASLNLGVFLCQRCAGIHRGLGVHISQVRSTTLDAWTCTQVDFLSATGNAVANAHWEAQLPVGFQRPRAEDADGRPSVALEGFIRRKYDSKAYASRAEAWPPQALTDGAAGSSSSDDEEEEAVRHFRRPGPSAVREGAGHPGLRVQLRPTAPPPTPARALPSAPPLPRKPLPAMPAVPEAAPLAPAPRPFFEEDFGECAPACAAPPSPSSHLHPPPSFYGASREPMSFISTPNASPASMAAASVNGFSFPEALAPVASPPAVAPARSVFNDMFDLGLGASPPAAPPPAPAVDILQQLLCSPPTTSPVSFDSLFGPLPTPKATSALAAPRATPLPDLLGKPLLPLPLHSASPHLMRQPPGRYAQDAAPLGAMHPHMHSPLRPGVLLGATAANGVPSPSRGGPSPRTHDPFFALTGL